MLLRLCGLTIEATRYSLYAAYAAHSGASWGLWIELQQAHLARLWFVQRERGSIEVWAGPVYAVVDWAAPGQAVNAVA